jgi:NAD+ diphosphatase
MFYFCPSCSSKKIKFEDGKVFRCPDCGYVYYHNVAAANGCVISVPSAEGELLVFTVRGKDPGKGLLDLPGGFVDPGEGVLDGLYRELKEEIGWTPPVPNGMKLADVFKLFASFSNVYKYKGIDYNTCDMYFSISAPNLTREALRLQEGEIADVLFLKPEQIDFAKFAFESTRRAVKTYLGII